MRPAGKGPQRTYRWTPKVETILAGVEGERTAWIEDAILLKAGTPTEEQQLRQRDRSLEAEVQRLLDERKVVQSKLAQFEQARSGDAAQRVRDYLASGGRRAPEKKQRAWAHGLGVSWEIFERVKAEASS